MSDDRKAVEQAIEWARQEDRVLRGQWIQPRPLSGYAILADAAEKWLATQPKPLWKVHVWDVSGPPVLTEWKTVHRALLHASAAFTAGARKVEIEKP